MKLLHVALIGIIGVVASLQAASAINPVRNTGTFEQYDKNKDGSISELEFNETKTERLNENAAQGRLLQNAANNPDFNFFDTNKDGKIIKDEFEKAQALWLKNAR